jgi:predicted DNA-binding protein
MKRGAEKLSAISVRIPLEMLEKLDSMAKAWGRSRSFLAKEALDNHLAEILAEQQKKVRGNVGRAKISRP